MDIDTTFMAIVGIKKIAISGKALSKWGSTRLRVALVLDTTGSMADDGKINALKTATKKLITQLQNAVTTDGDVYVSIIPFSKNVNRRFRLLHRLPGSTGPTGNRSRPS